MPRPTDTIISAWVKIDGLLCFLEDFLRLVAHDAIRNIDIDRFNRRRALPRFDFIGAEGAILKRDKAWAGARKTHVGDKLSLKHLAREEKFSVFVLYPMASLMAVVCMAVASLGTKSRTW